MPQSTEFVPGQSPESVNSPRRIMSGESFTILSMLLAFKLAPILGFVIAWQLALLGVFGDPDRMEMEFIGVMIAGFAGGSLVLPFFLAHIFRVLAKALKIELGKRFVLYVTLAGSAIFFLMAGGFLLMNLLFGVFISPSLPQTSPAPSVAEESAQEISAVQYPTPIPSNSPVDTQEMETYSQHGLRFSYSTNFVLENVIEEAPSQPFLEIVKRNPPELLASITLTRKIREEDVDYNSEFPAPELTIAIMSNPEALTVADWYSRYQYYPMSFGQGDGIGEQVPLPTTFLDGQQVYEYSQNAAAGLQKNIMVTVHNKMYLLRMYTRTEPVQAEVDAIISSLQFEQ